MARIQAEGLPVKLNSKTKNQEELPLMHIPEVRWMTGAKGREHWRVEEAMIQTKKQQERSKLKQKRSSSAKR